ncbi:hypothetical protein [Streptomyces sp. WG5]|uniref:hypothetical protein n=1 Tax=Streptomyces sp. WG5 TaxID=3417648 RepID=UPI003CF53F1D
MPETLQEDQFAKAAKRHFEDADYVHRDSRLPTADHLYGFAAECAVKSLLLRFTDVEMGPSNKPEIPHPSTPEDGGAPPSPTPSRGCARPRSTSGRCAA